MTERPPHRPNLETERLVLRWLEPEDDAFILELVNEPGWIRFIGDRGIHDLAAARAYIEQAPRAQCLRLGFGLNHVATRATGESVGVCGLVARDGLRHPDLGFAFLQRHTGQGFATEASRAVLRQALGIYGLTCVLAICSSDNLASHRVLQKLGFVRRGPTRLEADAEAVELFALEP